MHHMQSTLEITVAVPSEKLAKITYGCKNKFELISTGLIPERRSSDQKKHTSTTALLLSDLLLTFTILLLAI